MSGHKACPVEVYVNGEGSLPVCDGDNSINWDRAFFAQLGQEELEENDQGEDDDQGEEIETSQKIKTYKDANK